MRRFVKPAVWAAVFLACAGAGAFIAANTDPFPPGVDRPTGTGPTGLTGPSPSPEPVIQRWTGTMQTAARHALYVGGTCRSRWRTELRVMIEPSGVIEGTGVASPIIEASCDFPEAQQQARRIRMAVNGRRNPSGVFRMTFDHVTPSPVGSTDLGGFLVFLPDARLVMGTEPGGSARSEFHEERDDGNRGTYVFNGSVRVRCGSGCTP
jgi:hypothetical protein